jgi:hypothetical protein
MKYAIYDKAADAYLTSMEFDTDIPDTALGLKCGYNEYITEAQLLDTKKTADNVVARIEGCKFMEKGRFVIHSFDDTLKDQYIISEAGIPTKVVDNITINLDGTINVKYGTMVSHWSATSLEYAVNRMNALQKSKSPIYTAWCNTFDIYKVITVIDERSCTHYQFIKVTEKGLTEYEKDEVLVVGKEIIDITETLNKRIEELEKANYELGQTATARGVLANRLREEHDDLKTKVESIKKEARNWKKLYEKADSDREELKNVIDIIHTDLVSSTACDDLKDTLKALSHNSGLDYISMENFLTAKDEIHSIVSHVITILESRELNQSVAFSAAKMENELKDEIVGWKNKAQKAEKALDDQKKLNDANKATIAQMVVEKRAMDKELSDWKMRTEEAIRGYTKCNEALGEWKKKYRAIQEERDKALERAEFYKRQANSVYGMTIPSRCNGKQMFCDIATGKKILIDKKKYDELVEWIDAINTTYDTTFFMNKPAYLPIMIEHLNNLTK